MRFSSPPTQTLLSPGQKIRSNLGSLPLKYFLPSLLNSFLASKLYRHSHYFTVIISSVLTESSDSGGSADTERKAAVKTIPTLGHQPVILGGLYSAVEDEFLPGKTSLSSFLLFFYFFFLLLLLL